MPLRIGVRICISCKPSQPVNFGRRFVTSSCIVQTTSSAYARRMKKKSVPVSFSTGSCPSLILWAFMMIALSCACRNTCCRRTVFSRPLRIMSFSTLPGPTDGSWSTSPTKMILEPRSTARRSACIRPISTMDVSSIIITSASMGLFSSRSKLWRRLSSFTKLIPSRRWMVCASMPVASVMRFAARPVGAASTTSCSSSCNIRSMALMVVVLPVPGPPVIISTPLLMASSTASRCSSASITPVSFSTRSIARAMVFASAGSYSAESSSRCFATAISA